MHKSENGDQFNQSWQPNERGVADPILEADYRKDADAYLGYAAWTLGLISARYIKWRINVDSSVGIPVIIGMKTTVDAVERSETGTAVVGVSGLEIAFGREFLAIPYVDVQVRGSTPLYPSREIITQTGFIVHVFDQNGNEVGGTIDWKATGA